MGTPAFAVPAFRAVAAACDVALVVTQPDRPTGRGQRVAATAVAGVADELGLPVLKPERVNDEAVRAEIAAARPEFFAVVAFGAILGSELLELPRLGSINLHGSLLPLYRGASPVQRALWDGRAASGVTTIWMDLGIDTGDMIMQRWTPIEPRDNAGTLANRLAELGAPLLAESLVLALEGRAPRLAQDRAAGSYARKLAKQDGVVDWALDAEVVWNRQRAVTPWPGAVSRFRGRQLGLGETWPLHRLAMAEAAGTVLRVSDEGIDVACAPGILRILRVKPEAKAEMNAAEWARGARIATGDTLEIPREEHA